MIPQDQSKSKVFQFTIHNFKFSNTTLLLNEIHACTTWFTTAYMLNYQFIADGIFVFIEEMWLIALMVIQILSMCSYIMIGCHGKKYTLLMRIQTTKHVVNISLYPMFRGMKPRDLLLRRYWRREEDGSYGTVLWSKIFMLWSYSSLNHCYKSIYFLSLIL